MNYSLSLFYQLVAHFLKSKQTLFFYLVNVIFEIQFIK